MRFYKKDSLPKLGRELFSALILVLILLLILVLLVGLAVLVLLLVLLIHNEILPFRSPRCGYRIPGFSGFILGPKQKTGCQTRGDGGSYAPGGGFQSAGKNAQKTLLIYRFPDTFGKGVSEAG